MVKAMRRSAVLAGLGALGLFFLSTPVVAEVQNVRVGGDVTVRAFHRENLDLHQEDQVSAVTSLDDEDDFLMQTTAVNIGADLTENVSATLRVVNERDWDSTVANSAAGAGDIELSQAYVTLKELFYAPLTLRIGTQPIVWGRGFVLGSNLFPSVNTMGNDRNAAISANEFTDLTSFDAIRATLDLAGVAGLPLTVDGVYIKLDENVFSTPDDVNLMGVNVGTRVDAMNTELEAYYVNKRDKNTDVLLAASRNDGSVSTVGVRGSAQPMHGSSVWGELAYQFGRRNIDPAAILPSGDAQQAWGVNLGLNYTLAEVSTSPTFGAEWRFYSGKDVQGAVNGWAPMAPGYFTTALREFQTGTSVAGFYGNDQVCYVNGAATGDDCTASGSNQHELAVFASFKPLEDLTIAPRLSWFILDVGAIPTSTTASAAAADRLSKRKHYAGMEWDTMMTYNYTDDVQLGVIYALFLPGNVYRSPNDSTAQELVSSVSVKF